MYRDGVLVQYNIAKLTEKRVWYAHMQASGSGTTGTVPWAMVKYHGNFQFVLSPGNHVAAPFHTNTLSFAYDCSPPRYMRSTVITHQAWLPVYIFSWYPVMHVPDLMHENSRTELLHFHGYFGKAALFHSTHPGSCCCIWCHRSNHHFTRSKSGHEIFSYL